MSERAQAPAATGAALPRGQERRWAEPPWALVLPSASVPARPQPERHEEECWN